MPKLRNAKLDTASARLALAVRDKPHYLVKAVKGCWLGYRRVKQGAGSWYCRVVTNKSEWSRKLAIADDYEKAKPPEVLDYWGALDLVRKLARREPGDPVDEIRPTTLRDALAWYKQHLAVNNGDTYNSDRLLGHLSDAMLHKPISLLNSAELVRWRDGLATTKGLSLASCNRLRTCLRACLSLAAKRDKRIKNRHVWQDEFEALPNATRARNIVLDPATVSRVIAAAYATDHGAWFAGRCHGANRIAADRRLRGLSAAISTWPRPACSCHGPARVMPTGVASSGPNGWRCRFQYRSARKLAEQTIGRKPDAPLLRRANGEAWGDKPFRFYTDQFAAIVAALDLDPETTIYSAAAFIYFAVVVARLPGRGRERDLRYERTRNQKALRALFEPSRRRRGAHRASGR